jgi:hypothetical protein
VYNLGVRRGIPTEEESNTTGNKVTKQNIENQMNTTNPNRLHDLTEFQQHWDLSRVSRKHANKCFVCGQDCYHKCVVCDVPLHGLNSRSANAVHCFIDYHNKDFFGLARGDCALLKTLQRDWQPPTPASRKRNALHIASILEAGGVSDAPVIPKELVRLTRNSARTQRTSEVAQMPPAEADEDDSPKQKVARIADDTTQQL